MEHIQNNIMKGNLLSQAEFLSLFADTRFRYIHDVSGLTVQGDGVLDMSWNQKGYGIFYTVNGFPSAGKADQSQLVSLNANYVDFDVDASLPQEAKGRLIQEAIMSGIEAGIPTPTVINRTQKGAHLIWLYAEKLEPTLENLEKWRNVQKRLVRCFKGDKAAVDSSRVLRVPYTMHLKDPANPYEITVMSYKPEARCTLGELDATVPESFDNEIADKTPAMELLLKGVPIGEGLRHSALRQVAGIFLRRADTAEKVAIARTNYYNWDQKIVGSPERSDERKRELDNVFDGVLKREASKKILPELYDVTPQGKPRLWNIGEILMKDFGEEAWLVESLISKQGITALSGNPGDFKTWITIHIAICVSRGLSVFGKFPTTKGCVLIIDEEDHLRLLKKRLELLGATEKDNIHYLSQSGIKVDDETTRDAILEIVKEKNIKLLILDSLVRVHRQDENDARGMAKVFSSLQKVITAGASILFTHHHRKEQGHGTSNPAQSMRGSSDILAAVDCHIAMTKKRDEDRLIVRQTKLRQGELLLPFEVSILKSTFGPSGFEFAGGYDEKKQKSGEAAECVVALLEDGVKTRKELIEIIKGYGRDTVEAGIKLAEEAGDIERVPKEELPKNDKKAYYRITGEAPTTLGHANDLPSSVSPTEAGKQEDEECFGDFGDDDQIVSSEELNLVERAESH